MISDLENLVRSADTDRFFTTPFMPSEKRPDVMAVYGFNVELAKVSDVTSEPMIGEIRLQWWRDAVEEICSGRGREHFVVKALEGVVRRYGLKRAALDAMIDARQFDLYSEHMKSEDALRQYCRDTAGNVLLLAVSILDPDAAEQAELQDLVSHAAVAIAIANILRATAYHAGKRQCFFVAQGADTKSFDIEAFFAGKEQPAMNMLVSRLMSMAKDALGSFRKNRRSISDAALPAFLPVALAGRYLDAVDRRQDELLSASIDLAKFSKQWAYLRAYLFRTL